MKRLSVIVTGAGNNQKFINNIFRETGEELTVELKENELLFYNVDNEKSSILYTSLAKNVIGEYSKKILVRIINKNCDYFNKKDKYEIWKLSVKRLLTDEFENNSDYADRLENVRKNIEEYLKSSDKVFVEGFVNFRLGELEEELEDIVEECVQDYLLELEYADFVNMLKCFLSLQNSRYLKVDIIYGDKIVIKGDGKDVTRECLTDFLTEKTSDESNIDDFLLNSLITIAPKRVNIVQKNRNINEELKKTLLGIFAERITISE